VGSIKQLNLTSGRGVEGEEDGARDSVCLRKLKIGESLMDGICFLFRKSICYLLSFAFALCLVLFCCSFFYNVVYLIVLI